MTRHFDAVSGPAADTEENDVPLPQFLRDHLPPRLGLPLHHLLLDRPVLLARRHRRLVALDRRALVVLDLLRDRAAGRRRPERALIERGRVLFVF